MLQAHSLLWNYLWVGPNLLLLVLAWLLWHRKIYRRIPVFFVFAIVSALGDIAVFVADVTPSVSPVNFWRVDWAYLLTENLVKFVVIGEVFSQVLKPYPSVSHLGRIVVSGVGAVLVVLALLVAAFSPGDSSVHLISGAHLLEQIVFTVELGLILVIFLFGAYFHLAWDRLSFGILLGFGISSCGHLAGWAISANAAPSPHGRVLLDFLDMATHHICVLIWCYFLLIPKRTSIARPLSASGDAVESHKEHLEVWNQELERLLHQ